MASDSTTGLRPECRRMLEGAGFTYSESLVAWVNRDAGRVLTFDAEQQTTETITALLARK